MKKEQTTKKLTLVPLVLMLFTTVFGFANVPRSFYLMGYSSIPWYILSAIFYCIPLAFMIAEYGAAFRKETGGIYSWMEKSVNSKYAFIGTFMWYAAFVIWMINVSATIWIPLSNCIFGKDTTSTWSILGLNSTQTLGLLAILWIILVTFIASKGLDKVKKVASIGGSAVAMLNIVLLIGAVIVLIANKGTLIQPIESIKTFATSPNPTYQSPMAILSFLVFAVFAFGGIEMIGGVVDQTENPSVTFPKAIIIGATVISIGYALGIFLCGIFIDWQKVLSSSDVNLANVTFIVMENLGYVIGESLGLSKAISTALGLWIARFTGLSMFLAFTGAFFNATYMPLKQLIDGTPKKLWPSKISNIENGIPKFAMKIQAIIVIIMILLVSFGGEGASQFFSKLVLMTNVAMTLPVAFMAGAFISFKNKTEIERPVQFFKSKISTKIASILVTSIVCFGNLFTIIDPIIKGNYSDAFWMVIGPIFFSILALTIYRRYENLDDKLELSE